jgi:hypothetical protein
MREIFATAALIGCLHAATRFGGQGFGACTRIRTRDQLIKSQLLYQLSYAGAPVIVFAESSSACRRNYGRPPALLSKLLSNPKNLLSKEKGKMLEFSDLVSDVNRLSGADSIATFIWMITRLDEFFISVNGQSVRIPLWRLAAVL